MDFRGLVWFGLVYLFYGKSTSYGLCKVKMFDCNHDYIFNVPLLLFFYCTLFYLFIIIALHTVIGYQVFQSMVGWLVCFYCVLLYSHLQQHNDKDAGRKTHDKDAGRTSLEKYSPLTLLQGFERVV